MHVVGSLSNRLKPATRHRKPSWDGVQSIGGKRFAEEMVGDHGLEPWTR
jgi:hypothetical protein